MWLLRQTYRARARHERVRTSVTSAARVEAVSCVGAGSPLPEREGGRLECLQCTRAWTCRSPPRITPLHPYTPTRSLHSACTLSTVSLRSSHVLTIVAFSQ